MHTTSKTQYLNPPELHIHESGHVTLDSSWFNGQTQDPYSCFYFVEAGSGILEEQGEAVTMEPNHAYLIPPGTLLHYECDDHLVMQYFHFNILGADGLDLLRNLHGIHGCSITPGELRELTELYKKATFADSLAIRHILLNVLSRILRTYDQEILQPQEYSPLVAKVVHYIQENLSAQLSSSQLAAQFFVAEVTLRQRFRLETGMTPRQYIETLLMFKAELLLKTTRLTINQISTQLGFRDQFYFSRRFAMRYRIPPQEYRRISRR